jgi:mRNA interferase RelE/StbE
MDRYEVRLLDGAKEDIEESGAPERLLNKIEELETAPAARGKPLRDELAGYYSLRAGDYRIIYEIEEDTVWIYGAGLRKEGDRDDIYERARRWLYY